MSLASFRGRLPQRSIIRVAGTDVHGFLQGLFCNDLRGLTPGGSLYGCFLGTTGRVMADSILMQSAQATPEGKSVVYADVDRVVVDALTQHLKQFKLRRKVTIEAMKDAAVEAAYKSSSPSTDGEEVFADPRATFLRQARDADLTVPLQRIVVPSASNDITSNPVDYDRVLLENGIHEGASVFVPNKSLPFEANIDMLGGVSFHKGCYLGQELTHRTHVMLVTRKRTVPLVLGAQGRQAAWDSAASTSAADAWGKPGSSIYTTDGSNKKIGMVQASRHNKAVGLLRLRYFDSATRTATVRLESGATATAFIPHWWDEETMAKIFRSDEDTES